MKALRIVASQPLKKQILDVTDTGISYLETSGFGSGEKLEYTFAQIDAVIRSATEPLLSIQIGTTIHKMLIRFDENQRAAIARIVEGAQKTTFAAASANPDAT